MTLRAVALPLAAAAGLGLLGGVLVEYFNDERPRQVQDERIKLYPDIDACKAEQSAETCDKAFAEASRSHVATAPRFESRAACEAEYGAGRCLENGGAGGGSWFLPAMAGFMLGRALGGSTPLAQPVYCDRGGAAFGGSERLGTCGGPRGGTGGGSYVYRSYYSGSGSSTTVTGQSASRVWSGGSYGTQPVTTTAHVTRGGFGATAASLGGRAAS